MWWPIAVLLLASSTTVHIQGATFGGPFMTAIEGASVVADHSPGFLKAAAIFKRSINESVDPCDDFYDFTCSRWMTDTPIPDDMSSYGLFHELKEKVNKEMKVLFEDPTTSSSEAINKLKIMYGACMDVKSLKERKSYDLYKILSGFGRWPIIDGDNWHANEFDLTELLLNVGQSRSTDVFVDVYVAQDAKNVSRRLINFDQGTLGLGSSSRDYYLNTTKYADQLAAYEIYLTSKISLIAEDNGSNRSREEIQADVRELIEFEKQFAQILTPEEKRRNFTEMYNVRKLSDLKALFPLIDWNRYFRGLMPFDMHTYLDSDPEIIITEIDYFNRLVDLLTHTDTRVITNYILFRYMNAWGLQLDDRFDDVHQVFLKRFIGRKARSPRWKECINTVSDRLQYASGAVYVRAHFDKRDRDAVRDMVGDLQEAFRGILRENDWMGDTTRKYALEKVENMQKLLGYPDFILVDKELDQYYENLTLSKHDNFARACDRATQWIQHKVYRRLIEPVDRAEFGTSSSVVNAFYSSIKNAIIFPAAILQVPFFDRSFPRAVNYGGMGAVIGHEITHGFDDQGAQTDKLGNLYDWWDEKTKERFLNRTKCIIDQYSGYQVPNTGLSVNGILTQGENIADNGGIKEAYQAYRAYIQKLGHEENRLPGFEHYTNDQIFFMSYAKTWCSNIKREALIRQILTDPHSPVRYRVNGVVQNQPEFAAAFKCPVGSKMNPVSRCSVW